MVANLEMPKNLIWTLKLLDGGMILYWAIAAIACLGLITLPKELMYAGYGSAMVDAWNWSFAPIDIAFSVMGLVAIWLAKKEDPRWQPVALLSLALTFCAGLMAISYWILIGYYDLSWWLPNLALMAAALWWTPKLVAATR
ncbi:MAG: hypothetical protein RL481_1515 [Pseudomonadota bacterium]|jgi:hypothetical protein